jgi:LmbE family N-acetylglucosaminyl deacetylase
VNVLAVGCHPDDLEILCAGTLARCRRRGDRVWMASVMDGRDGSRTIPPEVLARTRERELRASGRVIGASVIWGGLAGRSLEAVPEARDRIVDIIREAAPHLVITHDPECYHPNHRAVSRMVRDAVFTASLPRVRTRFPAVEPPPALVYMDTIAGVHFHPSEYVDIGATIAVKRRMLAKHRSQFTWLKSHVNMGVMDLMLTQSRFRGFQCGAAYAEAFRPELNYPLARTRRLLP